MHIHGSNTDASATITVVIERSPDNGSTWYQWKGDVKVTPGGDFNTAIPLPVKRSGSTGVDIALTSDDAGGEIDWCTDIRVES